MPRDRRHSVWELISYTCPFLEFASSVLRTPVSPGLGTVQFNNFLVDELSVSSNREESLFVLLVSLSPGLRGPSLKFLCDLASSLSSQSPVKRNTSVLMVLES